MPEKRSKYDTDPLDPDFVRRTEQNLGRTTGDMPPPDATMPLPPAAEEPTRRFDDQMADTYPSVFVPPPYQPPPRPQPQPFTTFGGGPYQPPATTAAPPPGPSSPYQPHFAAGAQAPGTSSRTVARLGLPENVASVLPYLPFYIGLVASIIELAVVPRTEARTRFHAAQGLALQLAVVVGSLLFRFVGMVTGSGFGRSIFGLAAFIFLVISAARVWQGKPHQIAPLEEPTRWLGDHIAPGK